jgi:hypothetical protein
MGTLRVSVVPVVLYGCKTWYLVIREECILMAFEKRALKGICVRKSHDIIGRWRKLHNEKLPNCKTVNPTKYY